MFLGWSYISLIRVIFSLIWKRDVGSGSGKGQPVWAWYRIGRNCGHCALLGYTRLWLYRLPTNEPANQPTSLPTGLASWFQPPYLTRSFIPFLFPTRELPLAYSPFQLLLQLCSPFAQFLLLSKGSRSAYFLFLDSLQDMEWGVQDTRISD